MGSSVFRASRLRLLLAVALCIVTAIELLPHEWNHLEMGFGEENAPASG